MWPLHVIKVAKVANSMHETARQVSSQAPEVLTRFGQLDEMRDVRFILVHSVLDDRQVFR